MSLNDPVGPCHSSATFKSPTSAIGTTSGESKSQKLDSINSMKIQKADDWPRPQLLACYLPNSISLGISSSCIYSAMSCLHNSMYDMHCQDSKVDRGMHGMVSGTKRPPSAA